MRRRKFITLLDSAAATAPILQPFAARAQQSAKFLIIALLLLVRHHPPEES
jgi:hypothetical protein